MKLVFLRSFNGLWKAETSDYHVKFTFVTDLDFCCEYSKCRECWSVRNIDTFTEKAKLRIKMKCKIFMILTW